MLTPPGRNLEGLTIKETAMKPVSNGSFVVDVPRVDYLTLTTFEETGFSYWQDMLNKDDSLESDGTYHRILNYEGHYWAGDAGNVYLGKGWQRQRQHALFRASGDVANQLYFRAAHAGLAEGWARCTRMDLQITCVSPTDWSQWDLISRLQQAGKEPDKASSHSGVNRRLLTTCYVGSRHSERFIRVYEKQSDVGVVFLRFEVEFKRILAMRTLREVMKYPAKMGAYLLGELQAIGDSKLESIFAIKLACEPTRETIQRIPSADRTRKWLMETVLPAFTRYVNSHETDGMVAMAYGRAIGNALGRYRPVDD